MRRREPDFENLRKVLAREKPERPTLFELFFGSNYYDRLSGMKETADELTNLRRVVETFAAAGCDHATVFSSEFKFPAPGKKRKENHSLNDGAVITDWESFEKYKWLNPEDFSNERLVKIAPYLPGNMKLMVWGPMGVLENVTKLMGYDNLCFALFDEPELVEEVINNVGKRLLTYYESALQYDTVGCICYADDWGFNTQTLLSPGDLRKYIFPWARRIVEAAHKYHKPVVLHSCGYFEPIFEDIVDMGFDARHSYEDNILPVEKAYDTYGDRIAILGGIDMDFICRETPENVVRRCRNMLEKTKEKGGYALGSGNSVPDYMPYENYMAMIKTAMKF